MTIPCRLPHRSRIVLVTRAGNNRSILIDSSERIESNSSRVRFVCCLQSRCQQCVCW